MFNVKLININTKEVLEKDISVIQVGNVYNNIFWLDYLKKAESANSRRANAKPKRRGELSGGGKKPWKQKSPGSVKQGSRRAQTSAKLFKLAQAKILYISLMNDPTTGGVSASFAMLGDFNIAEPGALIGLAGPRLIRETIGRDLPKGNQTAPFLLERGFFDFIVDRIQLKATLTRLLNMLNA